MLFRSFQHYQDSEEQIAEIDLSIERKKRGSGYVKSILEVIHNVDLVLKGFVFGQTEGNDTE